MCRFICPLITQVECLFSATRMISALIAFILLPRDTSCDDLADAKRIFAAILLTLSNKFKRKNWRHIRIAVLMLEVRRMIDPFV